jgi:hypothetical protein
VALRNEAKKNPFYNGTSNKTVFRCSYAILIFAFFDPRDDNGEEFHSAQNSNFVLRREISDIHFPASDPYFA